MPTQVREFKASFEDIAANATLRQLEVIRLLATHGPLVMHELASLHGISRSSATEVVDRLEGHGLVERRHDPLNRRSVEVALTSRATSLLGQFRRLQQARITALAEIYSDAELGTLVGLLEKLAQPGSPGRASSAPPPTRNHPADRVSAAHPPTRGAHQ